MGKPQTTLACWESWHNHILEFYGPLSPATERALEQPDRVCLKPAGHPGMCRFDQLADAIHAWPEERISLCTINS